LGKTPLDIMIENALWAYAKAWEVTERLADAEPSQTSELFNQMLRFREIACEWAHMAAPYVHPRLAAVAHRHTNPDGTPIAPKVTIVIEGEGNAEPAALEEAGPGGSDIRH
jgi:hypothetical protein